MAIWPASIPSGERLRFLFRSDQGRIDRDVWRRAALGLLAVFAIAFAPWPLLSPNAFHDLSKSPLFVPMIALTYAYAIFLSFFGIVIAISYINLSAKRFRDIGRPAPLGLASLLPFALFLAAAAHWFQRLVEGVVPRWQVYPFDAALILIAAWTIYDLGFAPGKEP
jgi:uncharacterized membrane protein YhaH (DUF805 family)